MGIFKSKPVSHKEQADKSRRSFMWKAGAGMSAVLAAAVPGIAMASRRDDTNLKNKVDNLSKKVGMLEDENQIRSLHMSYENHLDKGMYEEVVNLFTDDAEVVFNGGIFKGKTSVCRLYKELFSAGSTGKKIEPAPGFQLNEEQLQDAVKVAQNGKSAKARFSYSIQVGSPISSDSLLVKMARLQGEGIQKWWEGGVYKLSCVKDVKDGNWKVARLEYKTLSRADYRPGKSYASPISVPQFSKVFPEDTMGPDRLV